MTVSRKLGWMLVMALGTGCGMGTGGASSSSSGGGDPPDAGPQPGWQIGRGDHSAGSVTFTVIATQADGLNVPRDLDFHNERPDELWVVNRADDSTVTINAASTDARSAFKRVDGYALHFMEEVSSIAFGKPNQFGTCHESRNTYNNQGPGNDFMGPALWSADLSIYAIADPIGLGSHLDMLHESPLCMGIAHVGDNMFWVFDGHDGSLVNYDFMADHTPGLDDHSDGVIRRYVRGQVARVANIPSHMQMDGVFLYVADTGNARVVKLDTTTGTNGGSLPIKEPGTVHRLYNDAVLTDVVPASSGLLTQPSGLAIHDGILWVGDASNGRIHAFSMDGVQLNYLDTGLAAGALMGMTFGADNRLYVVDAVGNRVLRVDP